MIDLGWVANLQEALQMKCLWKAAWEGPSLQIFLAESEISLPKGICVNLKSSFPMDWAINDIYRTMVSSAQSILPKIEAPGSRQILAAEAFDIWVDGSAALLDLSRLLQHSPGVEQRTPRNARCVEGEKSRRKHHKADFERRANN